MEQVGPGLRVRFTRIPDVTAKGVLESQMYLPVILGEFSHEEAADHRDYSTVAGGEYSVPAPGPRSARLLRTTDLETLTLDWYRYAQWLVARGRSPSNVRTQLYEILRTRTPFQMLAILDNAGGNEELRMKATLRSIRRVLRPGERDTRYYTLEVKEWRDNSLTRRARGTKGGKSAGRKRALPTTATLTDKTSLRSLARYFYGTEAEWRPIANANNLKNWGPGDPIYKSSKFRVGDKIKIPNAGQAESLGMSVGRRTSGGGGGSSRTPIVVTED